MLGAVWSRFRPVTVADVWFPALSVAVPLTDWLAPSPLRVTSTGHEAMPDKPDWSAQVKCTVIGPRYQPLPFGTVVAAPVIVGGVVSTRTCTVFAVSGLPALSVLQ